MHKLHTKSHDLNELQAIDNNGKISHQTNMPVYQKPITKMSIKTMTQSFGISFLNVQISLKILI
ncbi:MAG: hypothetical protein COB14_03570 [Alphaproteobacteria bacterium]|nr:MAG: hypothetical protein COB14_03570 [Alphaproteobacteria bacterium]